jgi:hypothetical protein
MLKVLFIKSTENSSSVASVIILPGGDLDAALIQLVEKWTHSWLLKPAFWVSVNHVVQTGDESPKLLATVIGRNGKQDIDFIQYLSRLSLNCINLIAVRVVEEKNTFNLAQDRVVDVVADYVEKSKPISNNRDKEESGIQLVKVNLVFAPSERKGASAKDLYEPTWEANLVVAAEDRRTPTRLDGFLRYSEGARLNAFLLSNIASAAGIWSGQKKGIFEIIADHADLSPMHGLVRLMRTYVRGIISEGLSLRVAAEALKRAGNSNSSKIEARAFENRFLSAIEGEDLDKRIEKMINESLKLENGNLDYQPIDLKLSEDRSNVGLSEAVKTFFIGSWALLKVLPIWLFASVWNGLARIVTLKLFGERGKQVVKGSIDFPQTELDAKANTAIEEILSNRERLEQSLANWPENTLRRPAPGLWSKLRSIMMGNLDGSPLPNGAVHEKLDTGQFRIIGDLNYVLPSLTDRWHLPAHIKRTLDSETTSATWREMDELEELQAFLKNRQKNAEEEAMLVESDLEKIRVEVENLTDVISSKIRILDRIQRGLAPLETESGVVKND